MLEKIKPKQLKKIIHLYLLLIFVFVRVLYIHIRCCVSMLEFIILTFIYTLFYFFQNAVTDFHCFNLYSQLCPTFPCTKWTCAPFCVWLIWIFEQGHMAVVCTSWCSQRNSVVCLKVSCLPVKTGCPGSSTASGITVVYESSEKPGRHTPLSLSSASRNYKTQQTLINTQTITSCFSACCSHIQIIQVIKPKRLTWNCSRILTKICLKHKIV